MNYDGPSGFGMTPAPKDAPSLPSTPKGSDACEWIRNAMRPAIARSSGVRKIGGLRIGPLIPAPAST